MAIITYKPKYPLDTIIDNFANKSSQTSVSTFIQNNFDVDNTNINTLVNTNNISPLPPVNISLVSTIMVDYGDGPISIGMKESLVIINQNVQTNTLTTGDIFGNYILAGANTDFSKVTDSQGQEIVLTNLQLQTLIPYAPLNIQNSINGITLTIVRDLRKGLYDYNNYLSSMLGLSRNLAKVLIQKYG